MSAPLDLTPERIATMRRISAGPRSTAEAHDLAAQVGAILDEVERLRAGGCARGQNPAGTQYCAEAAKFARERDEAEAMLRAITDAAPVTVLTTEGSRTLESLAAAHDRGVAAERARCIAVARGCTDYLGGYRGAALDIYHHGIGTVVNALAAPAGDYQTRVVEAIGREASTATAKEGM